MAGSGWCSRLDAAWKVVNEASSFPQARMQEEPNPESGNSYTSAACRESQDSKTQTTHDTIRNLLSERLEAFPSVL
jgi:hypothetical protein